MVVKRSCAFYGFGSVLTSMVAPQPHLAYISLGLPSSNKAPEIFRFYARRLDKVTMAAITDTGEPDVREYVNRNDQLAVLTIFAAL